MHARENKYDAEGRDPREMQVDGVRQMEYDGLRGGELAWVLGRRFKHTGGDDGPANDTLDPAALEVNGASRYAHMAYAGLGSGVDRMQRLASTGWMEEMVKKHLGKKTIALHNITLDTSYQRATDGLMSTYGAYVAGGTVTYCPDPVHSFFDKTGVPPAENPAGAERISGVNVFETGPFLRGMQVNTNDVSLSRSNLNDFNKRIKTGSLPRNVGDMCVMSAIETEIRRRNFMDWSPDGIVLSKLESPTDQPLSSAEIDAGQAQLFNLAVQGPAITTAWTSDVRDHKLECQPMDKVFICLVADLAWNEATVGAGVAATLKTGMGEVHKKLLQGDAYTHADGTTKTLDEVVQMALTTSRQYCTAVGAGPEPAFKIADPARQAEVLDNKDPKPPAFDAEAAKFRRGERRVGRAYLTNFRLMRSTSSHMTNYSKFVFGKKNSRCGLPYSYPDLSAGAAEGVGSYIVGAWCVGTVLDSAASRSSVGTLVRTAPASMALNVNVNVCWWSSDKLYKHYMDRSLMQRGQMYEVDGPAGSKKRKFAPGDLDRPVGGGTDIPPIAGTVAEGVDLSQLEVPGGEGSAFAASARKAAAGGSGAPAGKR